MSHFKKARRYNPSALLRIETREAIEVLRFHMKKCLPVNDLSVPGRRYSSLPCCPRSNEAAEKLDRLRPRSLRMLDLCGRGKPPSFSRGRLNLIRVPKYYHMYVTGLYTILTTADC